MLATENDIDSCQFHEWYPILQKVSIKSNIIEVGDYFNTYLAQDGLFIPGDSSENGSPVSENLMWLKGAFVDSINNLGGAVFVKLNWSAPIDATWVNNNSAKCQSSDEVFCLIKSSDRIIFDLEKMYNLCIPPSSKRSPTKQYIVLRKWANLTPSMEFRLFIYKNRLTGICQRECSTYFPFLKGQMESIQDRLHEFYSHEIRGKLSMESFVLDTYIDKKGRTWVIDVNPFGTPTSPLMFEWEEFRDDGDFFEFRIVENESDTYKRVLGSSRGPVDIHMAEDFTKFMDMCKVLHDETDDEGT